MESSSLHLKFEGSETDVMRKLHSLDSKPTHLSLSIDDRYVEIVYDYPPCTCPKKCQCSKVYMPHRVTENCWFYNQVLGQYEYSQLEQRCERCRKFDEHNYAKSRKVVTDWRAYHELIEELRNKQPLLGELEHFELTLHTKIVDDHLAKFLNLLPKLRTVRLTSCEVQHAWWLNHIKPMVKVFSHNIKQ